MTLSKLVWWYLTNKQCVKVAKVLNYSSKAGMKSKQYFNTNPDWYVQELKLDTHPNLVWTTYYTPTLTPPSSLLTIDLKGEIQTSPVGSFHKTQPS
jgi:hypothetical protein